MRKLFALIRDAWDFFRPMDDEDFGEYGILMRDASGKLVPMDTETYDRLKTETEEAIEDFWFQKEAEAFQTHGEAILKPQ